MSADLSNKYLVFTVQGEHYGIPIGKVREVIRYVNITPIYDASRFLKGVINLRGKIVPIIDMRLKFGMMESQYNDRTIFVIVDIAGNKEIYNIGISVDQVHDVANIRHENLEKTPEIGLRLKSQFLYGIAKVEEKMIMIVNIDQILTTDEVVQIQGAVES